ncbi:transcription elongation factor Spt5 [Candidatus Woesearchaeota archaeon CG_4_10_14_0_8_um_filter_47_5]|nr:MAG: transcription elongation factor Spt5 [Candidatus Woesearchaeota archaeon CG_4_10_14_0_8_um_filter_47_5]
MMPMEDTPEKDTSEPKIQGSEAPVAPVTNAEKDIRDTKRDAQKSTQDMEASEQYSEQDAPEAGAQPGPEPKIFALRTTANREDQVMDFVSSNAMRKGLEIFSVIRPHGMRGYIFIEAKDRTSAEQAAFRVPYARGILPNLIKYTEIEHMLEKSKKRQTNIEKHDIVEIISGPFKREKAKITRVDRTKEEVVVELLESAVPIPITLKLDAVKVIRRETSEE